MSQKPVNIVWFCTDQQRYDTIHALGNPYIHTPNIDKLAEEGDVYKRQEKKETAFTVNGNCLTVSLAPKSARLFLIVTETREQSE